MIQSLEVHLRAMTMRVIDIGLILRPQLTLVQLKDRQRSEQNLKCLLPNCGSSGVRLPTAKSLASDGPLGFLAPKDEIC